MIYTTLIKKAIRFATKTHEIYQQQKRKGKNISYITHPLTVGLILARSGANEEVIAAGILHDTIEDSIPEKKVTVEMLTERFGENVATLVASVTEFSKDLPWDVRKREALEHIKSFSHDSLLIKSVDILSNASELLDDYQNDGEQVFARFNAPKEKIIEHYLKTITAIVGCWPDNPLTADLQDVAQNLQVVGTVLTETDLKDIYLGAVEKSSGWDVKVYIINTSNEIKTLQLLQGSFDGNSDTVLDLGHSSYKEITIPAKTAIQIDHMDDAGELDFTTYYNIRVGENEYVEQINGWSFFSKDQMVDIPILNEKGYFSGFGKVGKL